MRSRAPILLSITGILLIVFAILPALIYFLENLVNPRTQLLDPSDVSLSLKSLTRASDWFSQTSDPAAFSVTTQTHFTFDYPRLGITSIPVIINGNDLKKGAIHFPGTALPGQYGNSVIFGHSALPVFFKKSSPLVVFNPVLKAGIGDEIFINYDGIRYRYIVRKTAEVEPARIEVLFQDFSRKELTLVTCTPLGTYWKRFVVLAELVN